MYFTHTSWRWNFCICGLDTSVCVNRLAWSPATTWLSPIPGDAIFNHRQSSQNLLLSSKKKTKKQSYGIISLFLSLPSRGITHRQDPYNTMYWEYICTSSTGTTDDILLLLLLLISVSRVTTHCHLQSSLLFHHSDWWKDQQQRRFVLFQVLWFQSYVLPFRRLFSFSRSLSRDETIINCRSKTFAIYNNRNNKQQQN